MSISNQIRQTFEHGNGVLRLIPNFVPRCFGKAGRRLRLHPDDYYALGMKRGAICERWFSSTVKAENGALAPDDEGMSYVEVDRDISKKILFKEFCEELGPELIGPDLDKRYGIWPMFAKFFDYATPLFHHLHLNEKAATLIGKLGKPEAYYFPYQLNNHLGESPITYFGFDPTTSREDVKERLIDFNNRDTRITELSRAYRIVLGTGWYTPAGVVHAPGSVLTYEPQWNADVNSVFENVVSGQIFSDEMLFENCPNDKQNDVDYIMNLMDWEENVRHDYKKKYFRTPLMCQGANEKYFEHWICYANPFIAAKELTIMPKESVVVKDKAAYGCVIIQGFGEFGSFADAESATMLRYGQLSGDEYFVSETAAKAGVAITNCSAFEPMVILKHFGPNNPDMPATVE